MIINRANLTTLRVAFNAAFQAGLDQAESQYLQIATEVPSTTGSEEYGWLGQLPNMREWIGDRVVHGLQEHDYTIKNKPFELTIGVPRTAIDDDQYGIYSPMFTEMGRSVAAHPDQLVFGLLAAGRTALCYDKQPFFSASHPVLDEKGKKATQSNIDDGPGGNGTWYVLDTTRALKPLIFQNRKKPVFVAKDNETDDNVFDRAEFKYGTDRRGNAGFGFWQLAQSSTKELNADNLWNAIETLESRTGDHGRKLNLKATLLVVPGNLQRKATTLLTSDLISDGTTTISNGLKDRLKLMISNWL
ncbi:Mu-like prophage major head subunit gpT [Bordetella ansorpii]|uniref:Mu-like prophage major head subunit gpT n=1 Tax=Bordetella ansorpii TaxID=288768 RepID=A0A157SWY3_9BORD|nr:Mu-like prophage major head subunit gpT family protein [Bordetella ansorpii]SAI74573.1 Mu-like prophage major head subunit gpT [Bordetella ansorpii]